MSPIFVRPVREQLEHDRLVRHLQTTYKSKHKKKIEVLMNFGDEQIAPVKISGNTLFPDLVLMEGRKLAGLVEVESAESVNNLEAMAQWAHFGRARVPFHLYVPVQSYDTARRLCDANGAHVTEIWTYRPAVEGFDLVRMFADNNSRAPRPSTTSAVKPEKRPAAKPVKPLVKPVAKPAAKPAAKPTPKKASKPVSKPAAKKSDKSAHRKASPSRKR